jgi:hypothetical protein
LDFAVDLPRVAVPAAVLAAPPGLRLATFCVVLFSVTLAAASAFGAKAFDLAARCGEPLRPAARAPDLAFFAFAPTRAFAVVAFALLALVFLTLAFALALVIAFILVFALAIAFALALDFAAFFFLRAITFPQSERQRRCRMTMNPAMGRSGAVEIVLKEINSLGL